ncbi:5,6-dimethylbenzimidazole synthase [Marinicellulosiphila megalodicopiae]|uniref:5,6-dimethylbenzimidazole synthase n=1 Tax=Marinicellulosiphila megalodicopiae TaxID=2724896 RepID=UPI003BB11965
MKNKQFTQQESDLLASIMQSRRDVRGNHFIDKPLEDTVINQILNAAQLAPSVGFSQPWEFVLIQDQSTKDQVVESFNQENQKAQRQFEAQQQSKYTKLKLEGIKESALNIAVFYSPSNEPVLGQTSMPEMGKYSVVCAIQNMWLMARSLNVGMGWVSILNPQTVKSLLNAPDHLELVAYLCVGYVDEFLEKPELEQLNWKTRKDIEGLIRFECFDDV